MTQASCQYCWSQEGLRTGMFASGPMPPRKPQRSRRSCAATGGGCPTVGSLPPTSCESAGCLVKDYESQDVQEEYSTLASLLLVTMQSNILKLYETETVDIARRVSLIQTPVPLPPGGPQAANNINADVECATCHGVIPLQLRLAPEVNLRSPAAYLFPRREDSRVPTLQRRYRRHWPAPTDRSTDAAEGGGFAPRATGGCIVTITTEYERVLIRADEEHPAVVLSIEQQQTVNDEIERMSVVLAETEAQEVVYHLTAH